MKHLQAKLYAFKSKTIKFAAAIGGAVALLPEAVEGLKTELPFLQGVIDGDIYKYLCIAAVVGTIYFRVKTTTPLSAYKQTDGGGDKQ
jgi:hypothetical protein